MVYNTLCAAPIIGARSCAAHPEYERHLSQTLPAICTEKHGQPVMRARLGALKRNLSPLCEQRPTIPATCTHTHGALHGHTGETVEDLERQTTVSVIERGFWKRENAIFRGLPSVRDPQEVSALALLPQDIGGHCLEFTISAQGWLYLHRASLTSECQQNGGHVRSWLQNIEQSWQWDDAHARKLTAVPVGASGTGSGSDTVSDTMPDTMPDTMSDTMSEETLPEGSVSWRCPLHWLQRFHDDDSEHQARGPSWHRNKARFEHITGEYSYAHPTVRNTYKLRGLRAARFISDTMACVADNETLCHSETYLSETLQTLLAADQWRQVKYVPDSASECPRVLDWPHDCGQMRQGSLEQGECHMRH